VFFVEVDKMLPFSLGKTCGKLQLAASGAQILLFNENRSGGKTCGKLR
jgi:hypothetical protein